MSIHPGRYRTEVPYLLILALAPTCKPPEGSYILAWNTDLHRILLFLYQLLTFQTVLACTHQSGLDHVVVDVVKYGKWQHLPLRVFILKKIKPKILKGCCIYVNASDTKQKFINVLCCSDYCIIDYTNIYFHSVRNLGYGFIYSLEPNKNIRLA